MIVFDLTCDQGHVFEGWFQSLEAFEAQLVKDMIACPHCGSTQIRRVPSAIRFARKGAGQDAARAATESASRPSKMQLAPEVMAILFEQMVSSIVANTEDVGRAFAEEARRIHYLEAPERPIRGEASLEEYESLRDEGIEVMPLPMIKKGKTH